MFVFGQDGGPMFEFVSVFVDEVIEDGSGSRKFHRLKFVEPPFAEVNSTVAHLVHIPKGTDR